MTHTVGGQIGARSMLLLHSARIVPLTQRHTQEAWARVANASATIVAKTMR